MSKINWSFKDELGLNLNRYLLTENSTGIQKTYDLTREANITQAGTPLNATNLNQLITAINDNSDRITDNSDRIDSIVDSGSMSFNALFINRELSIISNLSLNVQDKKILNISICYQQSENNYEKEFIDTMINIETIRNNISLNGGTSGYSHINVTPFNTNDNYKLTIIYKLSGRNTLIVSIIKPTTWDTFFNEKLYPTYVDFYAM